MQGSLIRTFTDRASHAFVGRCHELGLSVYSAEPDGSLSCSADNGSPESRWYLRPALAKRIGLVLQDDIDEPAPLEPGVWLMPIHDEAAGGVRHGLLALEPVACEDAGFAARCEDAGLDTSKMQKALAQVPRHDARELKTLGTALAWNLADLRRVDESHFAAEDLTEQLGQNYENITLLYRIGRSMSTLDAPQQIAQSVCHQVLETQDFGWVAATFQGEGSEVPELAGRCLIAGELPCEFEAFSQALASKIRVWRTDNWSKLLQPGEDELATLAGSEIIIDPIQHDGRVVGAVLAGGKTGVDPEATSGDTQLIDAIAGLLGTYHENAARFNEQQMMFIGTLEAVSTALDAKDQYTFGHSERVAHLAVQLARAIGLEEQEVERIRIAGLVHDVGKIGVPEAVLCKTGKLTDDEYDQIKRHPRIGYNILKGIPKMEDVLDGVLYHHERWDGRGYPDRLAGENIPLYGRILGVADTFDAMSSTRSYRQAMPREKVLAEIVNCSGSQFDPSLTEPFVNLDFTEFDALVRQHEGLSSQQAA